jgi:ankyrin repeat protein
MSLFQSVIDNNLSLLKDLIEGKADVNMDHYGHTALWWAANEGSVECATALINAKADIDSVSRYGDAPLHRASFYNHVECVRVLIKCKANVNALDNSGYSPLHDATTKGHLACVQVCLFPLCMLVTDMCRQILVAAGAESDRPIKNGCTPLACAIKENHLNIAEYLLHVGAKMKNVDVRIPIWMRDIIQKRQNTMSSTLVLKGVLKRRLGQSKDVTNLIAFYFWNTRLK